MPKLEELLIEKPDRPVLNMPLKIVPLLVKRAKVNQSHKIFFVQSYVKITLDHLESTLDPKK